MSQKQRRRRYSERFKTQAVDLLEKGNESVTETARRLREERTVLKKAAFFANESS